MARHFLLSRVRVLSTSQWRFDLRIPSGGPLESKAVAVGQYYNADSVAVNDLRSALKSQLDSHANAAVFTVSYSHGTGIFTIASDGATFDVTWTDTALRDWLGYTGDLAGANSYVAPNEAQGTIFPESGRQEWNDQDYETTSGVAVAESGVVATIGTGVERELSRWTYAFEPRLRVASPLASGTFDRSGAQVPWTWQDFWSHHSTRSEGKGEPFRYYTDTAAAITAYEDEYVLDAPTVARFRKARTIQEADTYWRVELDVRAWVAPA